MGKQIYILFLFIFIILFFIINTQGGELSTGGTSYNVSGIETLHDIYTFIEDDTLFQNVSTSTNPCHYISNISLDITGTLKIEGCTLEMAMFGSSERTVLVDSVGSLIVNYSNITAPNNYYYFYALGGSSATIKNSYISYAGNQRSAYLQGLAFNSSSLIFYNNTLYKNMEGIVLLAPNLTINDSDIKDSTASLGGNNIHIYASGAKIVNCNISKPKALFADVALEEGADVSIINSNYSSVSFGTGATLYRKWWYQAYVNDSNGNPVSNANVTAYNVSGAYQFNLTTDATGFTPLREIMDYLDNGTKSSYNNHTIYAGSLSYQTLSHQYNSTINRNTDVFTLSQFCGVKTKNVLFIPKGCVFKKLKGVTELF